MKSPTTVQPNILGGSGGELVFPWVRYWTPFNQPIQLGASSFWGGDSEGFLADPEDGFLGAHANKHLVTTERLLEPRHGCFVLFGDPGMGKTRSIDAALGTHPAPHRLALKFRDIPNLEAFHEATKEKTVWREWLAGSHFLTLVIDGVDEGLIKIDGFVSTLAEELKSAPVNRLHLVLACRSMEWPHSEGQRLLALWGGTDSKISTGPASGIYELCPLRECDVRQAAAQALSGKGTGSAYDGEFLKELKRHRLIGLGSRPLTLKMLLQEFAAGAGRLPRTHRDLYRRCARTLLADHDRERQTRLRNKAIPRLTTSEQQRARIAGRIAAFLLLCGRSAITTPSVTHPASSDLTFEDIMQQGQERLGDVPFEVTSALVESVLETPLFWPKSEGRVGFYHQTFAECLGAEYLAKLPFAQLRSLLFQRDGHGEYVHPQLGELAAWIAGESEPLMAHLLANDPEVLLRSDVSGVRDSHKAALVDAILTKARAEQLFDSSGITRFFHTLRHPGLARQLRAVLHDAKANHVARRMALDIAESCRLEEMLPDAVRILLDRSDPSLHRLAAAALDELSTPQTAPRLKRLLASESLSSGERLHVLYALLKHRVWTLREALPYIARALPHESSSGGILSQYATPDDTEALLRACLKWRGCFDTLSRFRPFVRAAHDLGLARIAEPRIRRLMALVWWRARRRYQEGRFTQADKLLNDSKPTLPDLLKRDKNLRLLFLGDLIGFAIGDPDGRIWAALELLHNDEFPLLIERAMLGSARRRRIYAKLATHLFWSGSNATNSSRLFDALPKSSELRFAFAWAKHWTLASIESREAAKLYYESEKLRRETEARQSRKPKRDVEKLWTEDLDRLTPQRNADEWLTVAQRLFCSPETGRIALGYRDDITASPGWLFHDEAARARIIAGARRLILEEPGNPEHRMGEQSPFDNLAYKALLLLRHDIELDRALSAAVCQHWVPTIYDEFSDSDGHHRMMTALAYRLAPGHMRSLLRDEILRRANRKEGFCYALREFSTCWDVNLATFVVKVITEEVRNPDTIRDLMDYLAEHDAPAAIRAWRLLYRRHRIHHEPEAFAAATSALAGRQLFVAWEELWPVLIRHSGLARHVFLTMDRAERRSFFKNTDAVSEFRLAELYLYLLNLFPKHEDPPVPTGRAYSPSLRMEVSRLRDEVPGVLAARGTPEAISELERIARSVPAHDALWIRWKKREALVALRRSQWHPPGPESVFALVEKSGRRWITDEDDLLSFVMESLARLERNLTASRNSSRDHYWKRTRLNSKTRLHPVDEVEMSKLVAQWLEIDLAPDKGLSVLRELQIQHNKRTDIEISAVAIGASPMTQRAIQVVIEVKGFWHPKIKTAHRDQLVGDYLRRCGRTHGIYLVMWTKSEFDPRRSKLKAASPEEAKAELDHLMADYDGIREPEIVRAVVLDVRPPI